jgi:hypothetical protein
MTTADKMMDELLLLGDMAREWKLKDITDDYGEGFARQVRAELDRIVRKERPRR